jgi:hypothetical protein
LFGASAANSDGIDGFQMARIRNEMNVNVSAAAGGVVAGCAEVILYVAAAENATRIDIFEADEEFLGGTSGDSEENGKAAAMAHAEDELFGAELAGGFKDFIQQWDQRSVAFQGEAFVAEVPLLQNLLEHFGADEALADEFTVGGRSRGFHLGLNPLALFQAGNVHELGGYSPAVGMAGFGGMLTGYVEFGLGFGLELTERIEVGLEIAPSAESVEDTFPAVRG